MTKRIIGLDPGTRETRAVGVVLGGTFDRERVLAYAREHYGVVIDASKYLAGVGSPDHWPMMTIPPRVGMSDVRSFLDLLDGPYTYGAIPYVGPPIPVVEIPPVSRYKTILAMVAVMKGAR